MTRQPTSFEIEHALRVLADNGGLEPVSGAQPPLAPTPPLVFVLTRENQLISVHATRASADQALLQLHRLGTTGRLAVHPELVAP